MVKNFIKTKIGPFIGFLFLLSISIFSLYLAISNCIIRFTGIETKALVENSEIRRRNDNSDVSYTIKGKEYNSSIKYYYTEGSVITIYYSQNDYTNIVTDGQVIKAVALAFSFNILLAVGISMRIKKNKNTS